MKSTYKLLTIYLDRKPLPSAAPDIIDAEEYCNYADVREEPTLLDYLNGTRTISGRWMLQQDGVEAINTYLNRLLCCRKLYCLLDYNSNSIVANRLFMKRMMQILQVLQATNPDKTIQLISPKENLILFQQLSDELCG